MRDALNWFARQNKERLRKALNGETYDEELNRAYVMAEKALRIALNPGLCALYVMDKRSKRIHRIGEGVHDSLTAYAWDDIHYSNLQNGDGGGLKDVDGYGYVIVKTDSGRFTDYDGHIIDTRFRDEIRAYLKENGYEAN